MCVFSLGCLVFLLLLFLCSFVRLFVCLLFFFGFCFCFFLSGHGLHYILPQAVLHTFTGSKTGFFKKKYKIKRKGYEYLWKNTVSQTYQEK